MKKNWLFTLIAWITLAMFSFGPVCYALTVEEILKLKEAGLSDDVIKAMIDRETQEEQAKSASSTSAKHNNCASPSNVPSLTPPKVTAEKSFFTGKYTITVEGAKNEDEANELWIKKADEICGGDPDKYTIETRVYPNMLYGAVGTMKCN